MASGVAAYAVYLKDELEAQNARKASFEQRGLAVVTTAGALVALLFGLTALEVVAVALVGIAIWIVISP